MAAGGALIATSSLPAFSMEEKKGSLFSGRGRYERMLLNYSTVKIGLKRPFSILHISDTHLADAYPDENEIKLSLKEERNRTFGGRQEEALADTLSWAKENVDYIVHTGDLIDWQSAANFDLVKKYFGENMTGSVGNHEFSQNMWKGAVPETNTEEFKDQTRAKVQEVYPFNISFCSQVVHGVNFITLDDVYGYVVEGQVEAFHNEAKRGLPIVLCMHVPFYTDDIWRASRRFWEHQGQKFTDASVPAPGGDYVIQTTDPVTRDFIAYLKTEPLLKAILTGHEHYTMQDRFSPTAMEYVVGGNFFFHGEELMFI